MRRITLTLISLLVIASVISLYAATGTPSSLIVRTDANSSLVVVATTQVNPVTSGVFSSRVLRTDASGNLQVILSGTVTPTYPLAIPASTCAAPSLSLSGAATNGIAFTATPSILECIAGIAVNTITSTIQTATISDSIIRGTITTNLPVRTDTVTWNNVGVTFVGWLLNVTSTASGANSLLMDLQVASDSKFSVDKSGNGILEGLLSVAFGAAATPALNFTNTTGFYYDSSDVFIGMSVGGSRRVALRAGHLDLITDAMALRFGAATDITLSRADAKLLNSDSSIQIARGTITTDLNVQTDTVTWNNAGVTFTGWKLNVTDTLSDANSLLLDLQVGSTSLFNIRKGGQVNVPVGTTTNLAIAFGTYTNDIGWYYNGSEVIHEIGGTETLAVDSNRIRLFDGKAITFLSKAWIHTAPSSPTACTSPSILVSNGSAAFTVDVGTSCTAITTLVVTLPAVTTRHACNARNITNPATSAPSQSAGTTTTATFTNYSRTTGLAADWTAGDDILIDCTGQ